MEVIDYLQLIEKELNIELENFIALINSINYSDYPIDFRSNLFSVIVTLKDDLRDRKNIRYKSIRGCGGIYLFKCTKTCDMPEGVNICRKWRENKRNKLQSKDIIYIGKANVLLKRIHSHYSNNYGSSSLCLMNNQKLKDSCFMIIFVLKRQFDSYKDFILSHLERMMHSKLLYAIGNK